MGARLLVAAWVSVLTLLACAPTEAGPPTDQVKSRVDRVIQVLDVPQMTQEARTAGQRTSA